MAKKNPKYVIFYNDEISNAEVTDDPIKLYKNGDLDPDVDMIYELGKRVIIQTEIKIVDEKPTTRSYDPY